MMRNRNIAGTKAMKLNFYMQDDETPKRNGGEANLHFKFIDRRTQQKRMRKKLLKKRYEYKLKHPLLEPLTGFATKCKTLENFTGEIQQ